MKISKTAQNTLKLELSHKEWTTLGKQQGWTKSAIDHRLAQTMDTSDIDMVGESTPDQMGAPDMTGMAGIESPVSLPEEGATQDPQLQKVVQKAIALLQKCLERGDDQLLQTDMKMVVEMFQQLLPQDAAHEVAPHVAPGGATMNRGLS